MTMMATVGGPFADRLLLGSIACVVLLAGCTTPDLDPDPVEAQWAARGPLPSCGSLRLQQGEELKIDGKTELACLGRAIESGRGAELTVQYPTTEGDPITDYYRVTPDGSTEVYTDSTEDAFSDQKWSLATCLKPKTVLDINC